MAKKHNAAGAMREERDRAANGDSNRRHSRAKAAKRRRKELARKRRARRAFIALFIALGLMAVLTRLLVFEPVKMQSAAMSPAYLEGDVVAASKIDLLTGWHVGRGDVVLASFGALEGKLLRRVAGLPGDKIDVREDGSKFLAYTDENGATAQIELKDAPAMAYGVLPAGAYLLLSDSDGGADSRTLGLVYETDIKAKAGVILWPVSRMFRGN